MLDFVDVLGQLDSRVNDAMAMLEKWRQRTEGDIAVLIYSAADDGAAVFPIPARVVRASTEKRDSKRGAAHDHDVRISGARASVSGVPISRKRPPVRKAWIVPAGIFARISRSSEPSVSSAIWRRAVRPNRSMPALIQARLPAAGFFSSKRTTRWRDSISRRPYRPASSTRAHRIEAAALHAQG